MGTRMLRFDRFRLDVANQTLWRGHSRVPLMPKPFAVLSHLVQHAGRLVTQQELLASVWPDTHVQPDVLRKHVKEIRRVLGDPAGSPRLIETVAKRGYRFIAAVSQEAVTLQRLSPTLVGRAAECAALSDHLNKALAGERQIVFVAGEAGMGKTSVVDAFQRGIDAPEPIAVAWGQAVEGFGGKEPYYPLLEALGRLGRGPEGALVLRALSQCAPTWLLHLPALVRGDRRPALEREAARATQPRMVRELCDALEMITRTVALIIILEDLHWVDGSTLDALSAIARRREPARLVIVGTFRPTAVVVAESPFRELRRDLLMHRLAHEVALPPLAAEHVTDYIAGAFTPNTLAGLGALVHRHSGGNPLFMTATLDHLVERGLMAWDGTCWTMTVPLEQVEPGVPDTLRHVLDLQLDRLSDAERRVLMCASAAGERFSSWSMAVMLPGDADACEAACDDLARRDHLVRVVGPGESPDGPTTVFEFKHALYRDAFYRRLTAAQRAGYHRRLAEALDRARPPGDHTMAGAIAAHYERAGVYAGAFEHLLLAADNALQRCAPREAIALLEHARDLAPKIGDGVAADREVRVLQRIGDAHYAGGDMVKAADAYDAAAAAGAAAHLVRESARALLRLARAAVFFDVDRALAACARAERLAADAGMVDLQAQSARAGACWELLHCGWSRERADAAAAAFRAAGTAVDVGPAERILWANVQVLRSEYTDAVGAADAALRGLSQEATLWEQLAAMAAKGAAIALLGQYGDAHRVLSDAVAIAARNENEAWLDILNGVLGTVYLHVFDFAAARDITRARLRSDPCTADMQLRVVCGAAELAMGRLRDADACFAAVLDAPPTQRPVLHWHSRTYARIGLAETMLARGDTAQAREQMRRVSDEVAGLDELMVQATAWELRARLAMAAGAREEAEESVEAAVRTLTSAALPHAACRVHVTAAAIHRTADPERAEQHRLEARAALLRIARAVEDCAPLDRALRSARVFHALMSDEPLVSGPFLTGYR